MLPVTFLVPAAGLLAPVLAQSANAVPRSTAVAASPTATATDFASLVTALPHCALGCLKQASVAIACEISDLHCLCGKGAQLTSSIIPCILIASCSPEDQQILTANANQICSDIQTVLPSQIAAAESYISDQAARVSTSASSGNIARRADAQAMGMGLAGAAAALAMLAL